MYRGDKEAVQYLESQRYWDKVKNRMIWVGEGRVTEAYEYSTTVTGWAYSDLCISPMFTLKPDDGAYCDNGEAKHCRCFSTPEQFWSMGPMSPQEEKSWLEYEETGLDEYDWDLSYEWWYEADEKNQLL